MEFLLDSLLNGFLHESCEFLLGLLAFFLALLSPSFVLALSVGAVVVAVVVAFKLFSFGFESVAKQSESILFLPDRFYKGTSHEMRMLGAN